MNGPLRNLHVTGNGRNGAIQSTGSAIGMHNEVTVKPESPPHYSVVLSLGINK
jgi:hypothetical protein